MQRISGIQLSSTEERDFPRMTQLVSDNQLEFRSSAAVQVLTLYTMFYFHIFFCYTQLLLFEICPERCSQHKPVCR